jgi:hypothetical protein
VENKEDIKRFPSLCSWCKWSITSKNWGEDMFNRPLPHKYYTLCLCDHLNNDGENNYPDKTECPDYKIDPDVTYVDTLWWPIVWAASEIRRLEMKKTITEWNNDKIMNK